MFRRAWVVLFLLVIVAACKKEEAATDTVSSEAAKRKETFVVTLGDPEVTRVAVEIRGTGAFIEQPSETNPLAIVLPKIGSSTEAAHVPYVAWREDSEQGKPGGTVVTKKDPFGSGEWRVYVLDREEVVFKNDLSANPAISLPLSNQCAPALTTLTKTVADVGCIPRVQDFLATPHAYNDDYVRRVKPSANVVGRMEFGRGKLYATVLDKCEWTVTKEGASQAMNQNFATKSVYRFELPPNEFLTVQLRHLDGTAVKDLVTLKPNDVGAIEIRFGNAVNIFPGDGDVIDVDNDDPHFHVYYDFLQGVVTKPNPRRTSNCHGGPVDDETYCGQGYIARTTS